MVRPQSMVGLGTYKKRYNGCEMQEQWIREDMGSWWQGKRTGLSRFLLGVYVSWMSRLAHIRLGEWGEWACISGNVYVGCTPLFPSGKGNRDKMRLGRKGNFMASKGEGCHAILYSPPIQSGGTSSGSTTSASVLGRPPPVARAI